MLAGRIRSLQVYHPSPYNLPRLFALPLPIQCRSSNILLEQYAKPGIRYAPKHSRKYLLRQDALLQYNNLLHDWCNLMHAPDGHGAV